MGARQNNKLIPSILANANRRRGLITAFVILSVAVVLLTANALKQRANTLTVAAADRDELPVAEVLETAEASKETSASDGSVSDGAISNEGEAADGEVAKDESAGDESAGGEEAPIEEPDEANGEAIVDEGKPDADAEAKSAEKKDKAHTDKTVISASGATYLVTATYGDDAKIADGATLEVREIAPDDEEYARAQQKVGDDLSEDGAQIPSNPTLFDISIVCDGKEVEPAEGSEVQVEVRLAEGTLKGRYTDEESPILVNDMPLTSEQSQMDSSLQVLHLTGDGNVDTVETTDAVSNGEVVSSFSTDSFSNWLLYLDEDLTDINVTTSDSLTLRPYTEWVWKQSDEPAEYAGGQWVFPTSEWNTWTKKEGTVNYTYYQHKTNETTFRSYQKTDDQLKETYTVVTSTTLKAGDFDIQTNRGKTIHVHVTPGASSEKPATVPGVSGLTVNLFDYDVPKVNGQLDFTHSGKLDEQNNQEPNPYNQSINVDHDLKFLGWGAGSNNNRKINNYTQDVPQQGIVLSDLGDDGFPVLNYGNPRQSLGYLFDTEARSSDVYAFPDADGLFQQDNLGYYYYNSNANYAEYDRNANKFVLYEHTYSQNTGGSNGSNAKPIGFYPFHEYDTVDTQPEMNFNKNLNHHFGMSMAVDFEIPSDRMAAAPDGYKHDIEYTFSGDDDLWVFVDDKLVLDIGGLHQPVTGSINFTTGVITVHGVEDKTMTFDVGAHTLKMFYLERGGCDSNLSVRFNLPIVIGKGRVSVVKKSMTTDVANPDTCLQGAVFGFWDNPDCTGDPYTVGTTDQFGLISKTLPIREEGQTYYMQEIMPPEGYLLDRTIYTLTAGEKGDDGNYEFSVTKGGAELDTDAAGMPIVRNRLQEPISLSVRKTWQNADGTEMEAPEGSTAKFVVRRYQTYSTNPLYTVILKSDNAAIGTFDSISAHAGDELTIKYKHSPDEWSRVTNCNAENGAQNVLTLTTNPQGAESSVTYTVDAQHASGGVIAIIIPESFTMWCNGSSYSGGCNPTFGNYQPASDTHETKREIDRGYERELELGQQDGWTETLNDLTVQETRDGIVYHYEYFIEEKEIPDGYEAIYLDSEGNPTSADASKPTNSSSTQTVVNRKLLDVPVEKHWADFSGDAYDWTVAFQLEEREVKVNAGDQDAMDAESDFVTVDGREPLVVSKGQSPQPAFEDLPMYRTHGNGTTYRIQYAVSEIAYSVTKNGVVVAQWSQDGSLETVGEEHYAPQFEQDAGEHGASIDDYVIRVVNIADNRKLSKEISLDLRKTWPEGSGLEDSADTYATFALKRYVHEEYRDYSKVDASAKWAVIELDTGNGEGPQKLRVPEGTTVHIVGTIKGSTNANKIAFARSDGGDPIELVVDNTQSADQRAFDIPFTAEASETIRLTQGDNYVVGGRDGFRLSDTFDGRSEDVPDSGFAEEFTLDKSHGWEASFEYLPVVEEQDVDPTTGAQTIYVYSYYLQEIDCSPEDFYPIFKDENGFLRGSESNRIEADASIVAHNEQAVVDVTLKKVDVKDVDKKSLKDSDLLKGAVFVVSRFPDKDAHGKDSSWGDDGDMRLEDTELTGTFELRGLGVGYYEIDEVVLPAGYVKTFDRLSFEVKAGTSGDLEVELDDDGDGLARLADGGMTLVIGNTPGVELPCTGGSGTTTFTLVGATLAVLAAAALVVRRRFAP